MLILSDNLRSNNPSYRRSATGAREGLQAEPRSILSGSISIGQML